MARGILCCLCGEEKEPERKNHGYCKACHHRKRTEERAKARAAKGLVPWGIGRNPNCRDCGKVKENRKGTYCYQCRNLRQKASRKGEIVLVQAKATIRPISLPKVPSVKKLSPEEVAIRKAEHKKWTMFKRAARKYTETCINIGMLIKGPCEVCGDSKEVESHHDDYYKPYDVRWLCRGHHLDHHLKANDLKRKLI